MNETAPLPSLRLFHYWRSSSSWRVRWAFALKGISCEMISVNLLSGESESPEHLSRNPFGFVPTLEIIGSSSVFLSESLAIMQWAEDLRPVPQLLPGSPLDRARIRQLAETINAGTQPLQNLGVLEAYSDDPVKRKEWGRQWIHAGLSVYEKLIAPSAGKFSFGDSVTLADLCLVPQCYNARRYGVELAQFSTIARVEAAAIDTDGYRASHPDQFAPAQP